MNNVPSHRSVKESFDLLGLKRKALKLAMKLFEEITDPDILLHVGRELDQSSIATKRDLIEQALTRLREIAKDHEIPFEE